MKTKDKPAFALEDTLAVYGIRKNPFPIDETDDFFFSTPSLAKQFEVLRNLAEYGDLLLVISGAEGAGKTTFLNQFLLATVKGWKCARIDTHEAMTVSSLVDELLAGFGLNARGDGAQNNEALLRAHLSDLHADSDVAMVAVDDAHLLPRICTEFLRGLAEERGHIELRLLLTTEPGRLGFSTDDPKRVHVVVLQPFDVQQSGDYLHTRLSHAGLVGDSPFSASVVDDIYQDSGGLPGAIHPAALHTLLANTDTSQVGFSIRPPWMAGVQRIVGNNACRPPWMAALARLGSGLLLRPTSSIPGLACASRHLHIRVAMAAVQRIVRNIPGLRGPRLGHPTAMDGGSAGDCREQCLPTAMDGRSRTSRLGPPASPYLVRPWTRISSIRGLVPRRASIGTRTMTYLAAALVIAGGAAAFLRPEAGFEPLAGKDPATTGKIQGPVEAGASRTGATGPGSSNGGERTVQSAEPFAGSVTAKAPAKGADSGAASIVSVHTSNDAKVFRLDESGVSTTPAVAVTFPAPAKNRMSSGRIEPTRLGPPTAMDGGSAEDCPEQSLPASPYLVPPWTRVRLAGNVTPSAGVPVEAQVAHDLAWLRVQDPSHYVIQLVGTRDASAAKKFAEHHKLGAKGAWFVTAHEDKPWYVVVYGMYPDNASARTAIESLPAALRAGSPWPRSVASVVESAR